MFKEANPYRLKTFMRMNERCPVCSQPLDMEPGFYYGTNMVSYVLALLVSVITFILWSLTIGFSLKDSRFFWWMGIDRSSTTTNASFTVSLDSIFCSL